jgi:asparagine synthase (glutamine-hydrolysing)
MEADVPLGAFLSGGVDSSTVVALMQAQSERPVRTFTIGWHDSAYNEAQHAKAVARHLGTNHTELYVTPADAMAVIPKLPRIYDEPFSDSSQVPVRLVSELAHSHVTVSLSGDGGDELFGGYNRYHSGLRVWRRIGWMPRSVRRLAAGALSALAPASWDRIYRRVDGRSHRNVGDKMQKLAGVIASDGAADLYLGLVSHWMDPAAIVLGGNEPRTILSDSASWPTGFDLAETMMFLDASTYLPDDILTKLDRASMSVGLEARVPLLDHRVVEFACRLPLEMKIRGGTGKWLLRRVLDQYVPRQLIDRPKMGFGIPIGDWLRGPLRDWAESALAERRIRDEGVLDPAPIRLRWEEHLSGRRNWQYHLWDVLIFQAWADGWGARKPAPASAGSCVT